MAVYVGESTLVFTGGTIATGGASSGDLAAEIAERQAGDEQLQDNIDAEEAARIAGDLNLQNQIDNIAVSGMRVVGDWDASTGAFPTTRPDSSPILAGDQWNVTGTGTVDGVDFAPGDVLIALVDGGGTTYANNWSKRSGTATTASQVSTDAAGVSVQTVIDRSDAVFPTVADAIGQRITGEIVTIRGEESSQYVKVPTEPTHTEKFQDALGNWWAKQNTSDVSILEFGAYENEDVDASALINRALTFLSQSQFNRGQTLDLGGLRWGVGSSILLPRYVTIRNGELKALGDAASWGSDYMLQGMGAQGNWIAHNINLMCRGIANGMRIHSSASAVYVGANAYKDFGFHYTGGGCQMLFCGASKHNSETPELNTNKAYTSQGYGLYADSADGKFNSVVVRGRIGTSNPSNHCLFIGCHAYMGSGVSETVLGSELVAEQWTAPWTLGSTEDQFVRKNNVLQTPGVDYTVSLDVDGYPTFTFPGAVAGDEFFIKVRLKDVSAWEVRGGNHVFHGCYFDNGYVDVYQLNNTFTGVQLYNNSNVLMDSQVRLWATSPNQSLSDFHWMVTPNPNLPTFKLMAEGTGSWRASAFAIEDAQVADLAQSSRLVARGSTSQPEIARFHSSNESGRGYIRFSDPTSTKNVSVGSAGDNFEVRIGSTTRLTISDSGPASLSSTPLNVSAPGVPLSVTRNNASEPEVATFTSTNASGRSYISFADPSTTAPVHIGSFGDTLELRNGAVTRMKIRGNGETVFPSTGTFIVQNSGADRFTVAADGRMTVARASTSQPEVARFTSGNTAGNRSYVSFADPTTTVNVSVGSAGDTFEVRSGATTRMEVRANGQTIFPATANFRVQTAGVDNFLINSSGTLSAPNLQTYEDNASALAGGLVAGDLYKTATGELRIVV